MPAHSRKSANALHWLSTWFGTRRGERPTFAPAVADGASTSSQHTAAAVTSAHPPLTSQKVSSLSVTVDMLKDSTQTNEPFDFNQALEKYELALNKSHCSPSTVRNYRSDIGQFLAFIGDLSLTHAITKPKLAAFAKEQEVRGLKPNSIRRKLVSITQFGLWLKSQGFAISPEAAWPYDLTQDQADAIDLLPSAQLQSGSHVVTPDLVSPEQALARPQHVLSAVVGQYLADLETTGAAPATVRNYQSDLGQFIEFVGTDKPLLTPEEAFTKPNVAQFISEQLTLDLKPATIHRKLVSITQFALWGKRHGLTPEADQNWTTHLTPLAGSLPVIITKDPHQPRILEVATPAATKDGRPSLKQHVARFSFNLTPLLNILIILGFMAGLSYFGWRQFQNADGSLAYPAAPNRPDRILSFQGRLTDTAQNPITAATTMQFRLYDSLDSGGTNVLLWNSNSCSIDPDQDGIFAANLGAGAGGGADDDDCGAEIAENVFTENANVWLQVTVAGENLTPRQPIRTVAYALNTETLQGLAPGGAASQVPYIDASGIISLTANSPTIDSSSGTFTIEGQSVTIQTGAGSNGNINLDPDGTGRVNILSNASLTGYLEGPGATLSATYAGGTALIARGGPTGTANIQEWQNSAGSALTVVDEAGNLGIGTTAPASSLHVSATAAGANNNTGQIRITNPSNANQKLLLGYDTTNGYGYITAVETGVAYNDLVLQFSGSQGNVGIGTTDPAAKLDIRGNTRIEGTGVNLDFVNQNSTTYKVGQHTVVDVFSIGPSGLSTAFNINSAGNIGISTTSPTSFKLQVAGNVGPSSDSTYNLGSLALAWANIYGDAIYQNGNLVCDSAGTNCPAGFSTNYWRLSNGAFSTVNDTADVLIGSVASASAKFAFRNVNSGTPVASISGNSGNIATYLTGDGTLATTNKQTLTIGNSSTYNTTGDVLINPNGTGNVGIGTTSTTAKLEVSDTTSPVLAIAPGISTTVDPTLYLKDTSSVNGFKLWYDNDIGATYFDSKYNNDAGSMFFRTKVDGTAINAFSILGNGNVGVNTTAPAATLHVLDTTEQLRLGYDASNYASFTTGSTGNLTITPSGNRVGVTKSQTVNAEFDTLEVTSTVSTNANTNYSGGVDSTLALYVATTGISAFRSQSAHIYTTDTIGNLMAFRTGSGGSGNAWSLCSTTTCTVSNLYGMLLNQPQGAGTGNTYNITNEYGIQISATNAYNYGGQVNVSNRYGISIGGINSAGTAVTNSYGLYLYDQSTSVTNSVYGIYGDNGDWVLDADGTGVAGGIGAGGDLVLGEGQDLELYHDGTNSYIINNTGDLYIGDAGTDNVILSANGGRVGIGTTAPLSKLAINGDLAANAATVSATYAGGTPLTLKGGPSGTANIQEWQTNTGTVLGSVSSAGALAIEGTLSDLSGATLEINDDLQVTGNDILSSTAATVLTLNTNDATFADQLSVTGALLANGNVTLGDANTDSITFTGRAGSSLLPITDSTYDLGSLALAWANIYGDAIYQNGNLVCDSAGTNCPASFGINYWRLASGALSPVNDTTDLLVGSNASASAKFAFLNVNSGTPTASISGNSGNIATTLSGLGVLGTTNAQTLALGNATTGNITLNPGAATAMTILPNGNVGIGTTAPAGLFDLNHDTDQTAYLGRALIDSRVSDFAYFSHFDQSGSTKYALRQNSAGATAINAAAAQTLSFSIENSSVGTFTSAGNLGIGTTAPLAKLSVNNDFFAQAATISATYAGGTPLTLKGGPSGTADIQQWQNSAGSVFGRVDSTGRMVLANNLSYAMYNSTGSTVVPIFRLDSSDNLNIGSAATVADTFLSGSSTFRVSIGGNEQFRVSGTSVTLNESGLSTIDFRTEGDTDANLIFADASADNVGIGTSNPASFKLQVAGSVGPNADSTYDLGSLALAWANIYGDAIYQNGNLVCDSAGTNCPAGFSTNYWRLSNGAFSTVNDTADVLIGNVASASAKFAFLNVNSGTPTASISGNSGNIATYLTGDGTLATANKQSLTIGNSSTYNTTGNVLINSNGTGNVGIGTTAPINKLHVYGSNGSAVMSVGSPPAAGAVGGYTFYQNDLATVETTGKILGAHYNNSEGGALYFSNNNSSNNWRRGWVLNATTGGRGITASADFFTIMGRTSSSAISLEVDNTTGNVGIGTTAPLSKLAINGDLAANAATISATYAGGTPLTLKGGPSGTANIQEWQTNTGTVLGSVSSAGALAIEGALSDLSGATLEINDDLQVTGNDILSSTAATVLTLNTNDATFADQLTVTGALLANGNTTLGNATTDSITFTGRAGSSLLPITDSTYDLGSLALAWANIYGDAIYQNGNLVCDSAGTNCPAGFSTNYWRLSNGAFSTVNDTADVLIGNVASASAKFAFMNVNSGTPTASISGNSGNIATYLTGTGTLATTNRQSLTIGNSSTYDTTGNVLINPNGTGYVGIGTTSPQKKVHIYGTNGDDIRLQRVDGANDWTMDIGGTNFNAGQYIKFANKFTLARYSDATLSTNTYNVVLDTDNIQLGQRTTISGTAASYVPLTISGASAQSGNYLNITSNGGTAGDILNIKSTGNVGIGTTAPLAKLSVNNDFFAQAATISATYAGGTPLTLKGGPSGTANIQEWQNSAGTALASVSSGGALAIEGALSDLSGATLEINDDLQVTGNDILSSSAQTVLSLSTNDATFADQLTVTGALLANGNTTLGNATTDSITFTGRAGSSLLPITDSTYDLGSLALAWANIYGDAIYQNGNLVCDNSGANCPAAINYWRLASGALSPVNDTTDLLIGSNASASAKFAVLNVNSGTPTASISGNSGNIATYLTGDGTLATANKQSLTIGNSSTYNTTGNVLINSNGTGNVGIGTTTPTAPLEVKPNAALIARFFNQTTTTAARIEIGNGNITHLGSESSGGGGIFGGTTAYSSVFGTQGANAVHLATNNATRLTVTSAGNVGIGTTAPLAKLSVDNDFFAQAATISATYAAGVPLTLKGGPSGTANIQEWQTNTSTVLGSVSSAGALAIEGALSDLSGATLEINDDLQVTGNDILSSSATTAITLSQNDATIADQLTVTGALLANGNVTLGNAITDSITFTGRAGSSLLPITDSTYDLGSLALAWANIYGDAIYQNGNLVCDSAGTNCPAGFSTNYWRLSNGAFSTVNDTADVLIGSVASASAKFAFLNVNSGTPTASISGNSGNIATYLTGTGSLATANRQSLTIGNSSTYDTTGNVLINSNGTGNVGIGTTAPTQVLDINGDVRIRGNDITDSADTTRLTIGATSTLTNTTTVLSGTTTLTASSLATLTSAASVAWGGATNLTFSADNATINGSDVADGDITIQGTSDATRTSSYVLLQPTAGNVGVGDTTPDAKTEILSTTEQLRLTHTDGTVDSRFTVDASGNLNIDNTGTKTTITDDLQVTGNDILSSSATTAITLSQNDATIADQLTVTGALLANGNVTLGDAAADSITFTGRAGSDLLPITDSLYDLGSAALAWAEIRGDAIYQNGNLVCDSSGANCPASFGINYWRLASGAFSPVNDTTDLLIGSNASASAKFAFLNVNSGTPTASISGNSGNIATYLTGDGTLATANKQSLTIGNSSTYNTTGNVLINSNGTGNVGIGTTAPTQVLDINGDVRIRGNDITDSADTTRLTIGATSTLTNTTTVLSGTTTLTASSLATLTSSATVAWGGATNLTFSADNATINGSDVADGDITIQGTSDATRTSSYVLLQPTAGNVGVGDTTPDAKTEFLATTEQLRLTHTDDTVDSRFTVDASGNLNIDNTGTKTTITDDLQVTGNDILSSSAATAISLSQNDATIADQLTVTGALLANGNTTLGNASGDTITFAGGSSGTGISFSHASFATCSALETVAGVLTCGTDDTGSGGVTLWRLASGAISPVNDTTDLLVGSNASASAKFAFRNVNSGTPVASISGNSGNIATYLTGDGTLATANKQSLTIGNSSTYNTTGNVLINSNGTGNVGIGTTTPSQLLDIAGDIELANYVYFGNASTEYLRWDGSDLIASDDFLPAADGVSNLGSSASRWTSLYVKGASLHIGDNGNEAIIGYSTGSNYLGLDASGDGTTPEVVIQDNGNTGIGTTAPLAKLSVNNDFFAQAATVSATYAAGVPLTLKGGPSGTANIFSAQSSASAPLTTISSGGNLAIEGNLSDITNATLEINDDLQVTGNDILSSTAATVLTLNTNDATFADQLSVTGALLANGNVTLGDANTDSITFTGRAGSSLLPITDSSYDLGSLALAWANIYGDTIYQNGTTLDSQYVNVSGDTMTGTLSFDNVSLDITAANGVGDDDLTLGAAQHVNLTPTANVGIGTTSPDAKAEILATTEQLRLTHTDGTVDSRFTVDASGNLNIDNTGTKTTLVDDLQITGNDLLSSSASVAISLSQNDATIADQLTITGALLANGNSTLGNASGDTITFAGGSSGTGISFSHASFASCSALETVAGVLTCGTDDSSAGGATYWRLASGAFSPVNDTADLLIGANASASAKFAFRNVNSGTPVASISGNSGNIATYLTGNGSLATTNRQTLTIGNSSTYDTTGNVVINSNGTGNVGIGTTEPRAKLDVQGTQTFNNLQLRVMSTDAQSTDRGGKIGLGGLSDGSGTQTYFGQVEGNKENSTSGNTQGYLTLSTNTGANIIEQMRIQSDGNVGIGTSTINAATEIASTTEQLRLSYSSSVYSSFTTDSSGYTLVNSNGSSAGRVIIGTGSASSGADLFVLDSDSDAADPTGTNGAMYYNSSTNKFRCYQDGAWYDCVGYNPQRDVIVVDEFIGSSLATTGNVGDLGWALAAGTVAGITPTSGDIGVLRLSTPATTNGRGILQLTTVSNRTSLGNQGNMHLTFDIASTTSHANLTRFIGLLDIATNGAPTNAIMFRASGTGNWFAVTRAAGVETGTATDCSVAQATTFKTFEIIINSAGNSITYKINGTTCATHTTNIPSSLVILSPTMKVDTADATARTVLDIDRFVLTQTPLSGADLAEFYFTSDPEISAGDIVAVDPSEATKVQKAVNTNAYGALGIISSQPATVLGSSQGPGMPVVVGLAGRVPVKVTAKNGSIHAGDPIAISDIAGYGMKATESGPIVGVALEDFKVDGQVATGETTGHVLAFIKNSWYGAPPAQYALNASGDFVAVGSSSASLNALALTTDNELKVSDTVLSKIGVYSDALIAKITAGLIKTRELVAQRITTNQLATSELTTENLVATGSSKLGKLAATELSIGDTANPGFSVDVDGNTRLGALLATGSATIGGDVSIAGNVVAAGTIQGSSISALGLLAQEVTTQELTAQTITAETASVSSLLADQTSATSGRFEYLESKVAQLENIKANTAELITATISGTLYADNIANFDERVATAFKQPSLLGTLLGEAATGEEVAAFDPAAFTASSSSQLNIALADLSPESNDIVITPYATFIESYLNVNGTGYIAGALGVGHEVLIGERTVIADGSLSFTTSENPADPQDNTFSIQPSGKGKLSLMAGLMELTEDGTVQIAGNLKIAGSVDVNGNVIVKETLLTNLIQPEVADQPVQVQLARASGESGSVTQSRLEIINETGTAVATISAQGRADFAGGLGVKSADVSGSTGEIETGESAGKAKIPAGQTEITIKSPRMTDQTLLYVTPLGSTDNQVLYVKSQTPDNGQTVITEGQFVVGLDEAVAQDVYFNWWIVD